jgi:acyl-CoA thioesterase I
MKSAIKIYLAGLFMIFFFLLGASTLAQSSIHYVALGDSYTIGSGGTPDESWPAVITQRLRKKGIPIELVANLGREGWTTQDLINYQLPVFVKIHPDLVSVLIGVNDWVQGVESPVFEEHFHFILDKVLEVIPDHKKVIVVTIPDFSVMPVGRQYSGGRDISAGIASFDQIIKKEAALHGLKVVDLYPLSQTMGGDPLLSASDGLHPSAKGYSLWADLIEKAFKDCSGQ